MGKVGFNPGSAAPSDHKSAVGYFLIIVLGAVTCSHTPTLQVVLEQIENDSLWTIISMVSQ